MRILLEQYKDPHSNLYPEWHQFPEAAKINVLEALDRLGITHSEKEVNKKLQRHVKNHNTYVRKVG